MALDQKTKIGLVSLTIFLITLVVLFYGNKGRKVDLIYFRKTSCIIVNRTDKIIFELQEDFKEYLNLRIVDMDKNLTKEEEDLVKEYNVVGVPVIVINGKEYTKEFTKDNLERELCKRLLVKPGVC